MKINRFPLEYKCKDEPWILTIRSSPSSFKNHLIYIRKCSESHRNGQNLFSFGGWFKFSIFNIVFNRIFNFTAFTAKKCNLINIQNLASEWTNNISRITSGSVFRESIAMSATEALKNADLFQLWRYFWPSQRVAGLFASKFATEIRPEYFHVKICGKTKTKWTKWMELMRNNPYSTTLLLY